MAENYFANHYARMNGIDPNSDSSIREWLQRTSDYYKREFSPFLGMMAGKRVLELGCGIGGMLALLQKDFDVQPVGVDVSASQLEICRRFVSPTAICSDASTYLRNQSDQFDWVIAVDFIEHVKKEEIPPLLSDIRKRLSPGGKLLLRTPNMGSLFGLHRRYLDFSHEVGFTEESLRQVLEENGFTNIEVQNSTIGSTRLLCIGIFQRFLEKLYNLSLSRIVTPNLIAAAQRPESDS